MDLEHLRYFQTVAQYQHITRAAEDLHISQPSLSKAISNVEDFTGTDLFRREKNKIYLNESGTIFLDGLNRFFCELDTARSAIQKAISLETGLIRIATSVGSGLLNDYLVALHHRYPDILISQNLTREQEMVSTLTLEKADFAISAVPLTQYSQQLESRLLLEDELLVLIPDSNPFSRQNTVSLKQLAGQKFIFNNSGMELRKNLTDLVRETGCHLDVVFESSSPDLIGRLMEEEAMLTLIPLSAYLRMEHRNQDKGHPMNRKPVHLSEGILLRRIYLSFNPETQRSAAAQLAISELADYFSAILSEHL